MYETVKLFDLDFISAQNHAEFIDHIMDYHNFIDYKEKLPFVITPNADQIVKLDKPQHQVLKEQLRQALFILPDGQPIVWFSKLVRKPLKSRLTGSDLFTLLWHRAKQDQRKILIIVSDEALGLKLQQDYNNIIYYSPPYFEVNTIDFEKVCQEIFNLIKEIQPQYVIIGLGFPKQEWVGLTVYNNLKKEDILSPLFLYLGASAEFYIGTKKRSPLFLQKLGFEWLHRLWQEPRRMWKRYILGSVPLFVLFFKEGKKNIFSQSN